MGAGGGLRGAAAVEWRRRQRVEKHGGRLADECRRRMWVAVVIWEVRRLRRGGGGRLLRSMEGGWLMKQGCEAGVPTFSNPIWHLH